jgi:hypothetical protein
VNDLCRDLRNANLKRNSTRYRNEITSISLFRNVSSIALNGRLSPFTHPDAIDIAVFAMPPSRERLPRQAVMQLARRGCRFCYGVIALSRSIVPNSKPASLHHSGRNEESLILQLSDS